MNDGTQFVRVLDVLVFGPMMIAAGQEHRNKYFRTALTLIGLGTVIYNGARYLEHRQKAAAEPPQTLGEARRRLY